MTKARGSDTGVERPAASWLQTVTSQSRPIVWAAPPHCLPRLHPQIRELLPYQSGLGSSTFWEGLIFDLYPFAASPTAQPLEPI